MTTHTAYHYEKMRQRKEELLGNLTPHERRREKISIVCSLALRWGFVSPQMAQLALGIAIRGTCSQLHQDGFLRKYVIGQIGLRHMPSTIYTLTENGLHAAERIADIEPLVRHNIRSPLANINKASTEHDYLVAHIVLSLMASGTYSRYLSSKEIQAISLKDRKQFDAVIYEKCEPGEFSNLTERPIGIEIELTRKSEARTYDFLLKLYLALQNGAIERVQVYTDLPSIKKHIESLIRKCEDQKQIPRFNQLKVGNKLELLGYEPMSFALSRYLTIEVVS